MICTCSFCRFLSTAELIDGWSRSWTVLSRLVHRSNLLETSSYHSEMVSPRNFPLKSHLPCKSSASQCRITPLNKRLPCVQGQCEQARSLRVVWTYIISVANISYYRRNYHDVLDCSPRRLWCPSEIFVSMNVHVYGYRQQRSVDYKDDGRTGVSDEGRVHMDSWSHLLAHRLVLDRSSDDRTVMMVARHSNGRPPKHGRNCRHIERSPGS
jgi:hypothetical protein